MKQLKLGKKSTKSVIETAVGTDNRYPVCDIWPATKASGAAILSLATARVVENVEYFEKMCTVYQIEVDAEENFTIDSLKFHMCNVEMLRNEIVRLVGVRQQMQKGFENNKNVIGEVLYKIELENTKKFWDTIDLIYKKLNRLLTEMNAILDRDSKGTIADPEHEIREFLRAKASGKLLYVVDKFKKALVAAKLIRDKSQKSWKVSVNNLHQNGRCVRLKQSKKKRKMH